MKDLLSEIAKQYKIHCQILARYGHNNGMSDFESEVDDRLAFLYLISKGYSYDCISASLKDTSYVAESFAKCESRLVAPNEDGKTQWENKTYSHIVTDISNVVDSLSVETGCDFDPEIDEFVVVISVSRMQYLSMPAEDANKTVRDYMGERFAQCRILALPMLGYHDDAEGLIWAVAKINHQYSCVRFHGI